MVVKVPETMQALRLHPDSFPYFEDAPVPLPSSDQILLRVSATAITRSELTWGETLSRPLPIPGHDVSGTIISAPPTSKFKPGDEVFGLLAFNRDGAAAEYAIALEDELCLKPKSVSHEQAAALPLSALTAWQALFQHSQLKKGMRLLITAASGGVGIMAVQIAQWAGAYVIGTCSSRNTSYLNQLGVNLVLDYGDGYFERWVQKVEENPNEGSVDLVLDCIGGKTLRTCLTVAKRGGAVLSVAEPIKEDWPEVKARLADNIKTTFFVVKPDGTTLAKIQELIDQGAVQAVVDRVWELSHGREAFELLERGHVRGKIVLRAP